MKFYTILYYSDNSLSIKDRKAGKRGEKRKGSEGASLVVHWLRLCAPIAGGSGLIPGQGTRIPHAAGCREKKKKKGKEGRGGRRRQRRKWEERGRGGRQGERVFVNNKSHKMASWIQWWGKKDTLNSTQLPLSFRNGKYPYTIYNRELILNRNFEIWVASKFKLPPHPLQIKAPKGLKTSTSIHSI